MAHSRKKIFHLGKHRISKNKVGKNPCTFLKTSSFSGYLPQPPIQVFLYFLLQLSTQIKTCLTRVLHLIFSSMIKSVPHLHNFISMQFFSFLKLNQFYLKFKVVTYFFAPFQFLSLMLGSSLVLKLRDACNETRKWKTNNILEVHIHYLHQATSTHTQLSSLRAGPCLQLTKINALYFVTCKQKSSKHYRSAYPLPPPIHKK